MTTTEPSGGVGLLGQTSTTTFAAVGDADADTAVGVAAGAGVEGWAVAWVQADVAVGAVTGALGLLAKPLRLVRRVVRVLIESGAYHTHGQPAHPAGSRAHDHRRCRTRPLRS